MKHLSDMATLPENDYKDEVLYRLGLVKENVEREMSQRIKGLLYDIVDSYCGEFACDGSLNPYPFRVFGEECSNPCVYIDKANGGDLMVSCDCDEWNVDEYGYVGLDMLYRMVLATIEETEKS